MEWGAAAEAVKQFGPLVVAVIFFIWRDYKREERLGKRLDKITDQHNEVMATIVKDNTKAMEEVALAIHRMSAKFDARERREDARDSRETSPRRESPHG